MAKANKNKNKNQHKCKTHTNKQIKVLKRKKRSVYLKNFLNRANSICGNVYSCVRSS